MWQRPYNTGALTGACGKDKKGVLKMDNLKYWIWLSSLKIIPSKKNMLLEYFKDPYALWDADEADLKKMGFMNEIMLKQLTNIVLKRKSEEVADEVYRKGINVLTIKDREYPDNLRNIYDPPVVLYVKGSLSGCKNRIAIVGSRRPSSYGLKVAEKLAYELSGFGLTVVSGLASGIDGAAHSGALRNNGKTIAVLGCGIDIVYPRENRRLYEKITETGAVISEYIPGVQPLQYHFPARNRIISGLSYGTVVVEAGEKSGSLITVNYALNQGREVFAVPGNINNINSMGTNRLIGEGAKIVTSVYDIIEELKIFIEIDDLNLKKSIKDSFNTKLIDMSRDEKIILEQLLKEPLYIDMLMEKTGFDIKELNSLLVIMEMKGIIEQTPERLYNVK